MVLDVQTTRPCYLIESLFVKFWAYGLKMNTGMTKVMTKEEQGRAEDISISRTDFIVTLIENRKKNSNKNKGTRSRLKSACIGYQNV